MNPSEKHILEIDSVELSFGDRRILSGVYFAVETGGVTAVLGRNGCGKSCLMKILCGSLRADFRSMRIDRKSARSEPHSIFIRQLLPHPLRPSTAVTPPVSTAKYTPERMRRSPNDNSTESISRICFSEGFIKEGGRQFQ